MGNALKHPLDLQSMPTSLLMEHFKVVCAELGILQVSGAPLDELANAQRAVDQAEQQLNRRISW